MAIRRQREAPDLKADTVSILLAGWGAPDPPVPFKHGFGGGFLELLTPGGIAALWRQHEFYLRDVGRRWHWEPDVEVPDGRRLYFAEAVSEGLIRDR
jgi:hypothetical protein